MFSYPKFNAEGTQILSDINGKNKEMMMNISVHRLKKKAKSLLFAKTIWKRQSCCCKAEWNLITNKDCMKWKERICLRICPPVCIFAKERRLLLPRMEDSEVLLQSAQNDRTFSSKLYLPKDIEKVTSCKGKWEDTARREVITIFDYYNAPYSNMVMGEILVPQGRWFSYIPHHHPQPEVYYYRLKREEGFGACFIGDKAYTIKDGSVGAFPGGKTHAQVTAPGYPMYCCWMIRHLDGNPWKRTRIDDPRYTHLLEEQ